MQEEHADDLARRQCPDPLWPRRLEVVDGACAELDGQRDRARLGELVAVEPEREPCLAREEVPASLCGIERPAFDEDVRRARELCRLGQDLTEHELDVGVRVVVLGRDRVQAEERRDAAGGAHDPQLGELGGRSSP